MKRYSSIGAVKPHAELEERMKNVGNCLNMIYSNDDIETTPVISISSSSCTSKMYVACTLNASEDTLPIVPTRFPYITEISYDRKKRNAENSKSKLWFCISFLLFNSIISINLQCT